MCLSLHSSSILRFLGFIGLAIIAFFLSIRYCNGRLPRNKTDSRTEKSLEVIVGIFFGEQCLFTRAIVSSALFVIGYVNQAYMAFGAIVVVILLMTHLSYVYHLKN